MNRTTGESGGNRSHSAENRQENRCKASVPESNPSVSVPERHQPGFNPWFPGEAESQAFIDALHRRICDRVKSSDIRRELLQRSWLEFVGADAGWPLLRLVIEKKVVEQRPGAAQFDDGVLLHRHYRLAMEDGCKNSVLGDLAASLVFQEVDQ